MHALVEEVGVAFAAMGALAIIVSAIVRRVRKYERGSLSDRGARAWGWVGVGLVSIAAGLLTGLSLAVLGNDAIPHIIVIYCVGAGAVLGVASFVHAWRITDWPGQS